jgi:hypothetical protein
VVIESTSLVALLGALDVVLPFGIWEEDGTRGADDRFCIPLPPRPLLSAVGDFRLARGFLTGSDRVGLVVLVFLTTTAGAVGAFELMDDPGLVLWELPGLAGMAVAPTDGTLVGALGNCAAAAGGTDPVLDARLKRLADCFVGCL